jgi:CRP-like cAMP-binding protein
MAPREFLFREGDPAGSCYLVTEGCLKLSKINEQGREVILRYVCSRELTAVLAVLEGRGYPVTAEAITETRGVAWDKKAFKVLMSGYPAISMALFTNVYERLEDLQNRYLELSSEPVEQRIARFILRLMGQSGRKTREGVAIEIPLTRQSIADYIGASIYTVSRTLSVWEKRGWMKSRWQKIIVMDSDALADTGAGPGC